MTREDFMFKDLFEVQRRSLDLFFDRLDIQAFEKLVSLCAQCRGTMIFTGVGKSGVIAQKISQTLLSTGTKAIFLSPMDALHGDIAMVSDSDLFFCLSKSGQTKELLDLIPYVQMRKAKTVALSCHKDSDLAKQTDISIYLPMDKELCPFNLAPTISTTVQLLFGDALAVALMNIKQISLNEYAFNHPAGSIGKKTSIYVEDLMIQKENVPTCLAENTLMEIVAELSAKKCGCIIVIDQEKKALGVFTDGDLRRGLERQGEQILHKKIKELMTSEFLFTEKKKLAWEALQSMERDPQKLVSVLPVLEKEKLVGIIRIHDILQTGIR